MSEWNGLSVTSHQMDERTELLAQIDRLETDLDTMTAELVANQDLLLALYDLTKSTRSHLDLPQMLASLTQTATRLVKSRGVFIALFEGQTLIKSEQYPTATFPNYALTYLSAQMSASEQLLNADNVSLLCDSTTHNLFLLRLPIRDELTAVMGFLFCQASTALSPMLKLARAIAEQAAAQIENAVLHQETLKQERLKTEMDLAAKIQLRLLPQHAPTVPGLDIYAGSKPALSVGGDFYDFVYQTGRPLTFTVGDVSGKGMSAAMLMAMTRTVIRSKAKEATLVTPQTVMSYANEVMYDDFTDVGMFATAFIGQYSPRTQQLLYAIGGHSPVIYCPKGGQARLLEADGTALGVLPMCLSEDQQVAFGTGDLFIVATDGFNEAQSPDGELFGYERLFALVEKVADGSAQEVGQALIEQVTTFGAGLPQDDDQTLVVIKGI